MNYINHFNQQTEQYLAFRPTYPELLFNLLADRVPSTACVWDCATGNGQAAISLAQHFKKVIATDINQAQLDMAPSKSEIQYICATAEHTPIPDHSIDLITVAQALHWFNFDQFYEEVRRVSKPSAWIAAWCYSLGSINTPINEVIRRLYYDILGDQYWPSQRSYIDDNYQTIPFPFVKVKVDDLHMEKEVDLKSLMGYLSTWSAVKQYQKLNHKNPIEFISADLQLAWGNPGQHYTMRWPLHVLLGRVN